MDGLDCWFLILCCMGSLGQARLGDAAWTSSSSAHLDRLVCKMLGPDEHAWACSLEQASAHLDKLATWTGVLGALGGDLSFRV